MKKIVVQYKETGECLINIKNTVSSWNHLYSLSEFDNKFKLLIKSKRNAQKPRFKVEISKKQAEELIQSIPLLPVKSTVFKTALTHLRREDIQFEKQRIESLIKEKTEQLGILISVNKELQKAII